MSLLTTKTARSIIYLCCIGGLLALNAVVVVELWNSVFRSPVSDAPELGFLEGAGLTAFAYVLVFAIRYGVRYSPPPPAAAPSETRTPCAPSDRSERYAHLTTEQRIALKAELVRSCGCRESPSNQ